MKWILKGIIVIVYLELVVKVYNINEGKNKKIQNHCKKLREYGIFISKVRGHIDRIEKEEECKLIGERMTTKQIRTLALMKAREECLRENILVEYLESEEVIGMWSIGGSYETEREICREQELDEARKEGEIKGQINTVIEFFKEDIITLEMAMDKTGMTKEEFLEMCQEYKEAQNV